MSDKVVILKEKFLKSLEESNIHFQRLDIAISELEKQFQFPLSDEDFQEIIKNNNYLAFADQMIYRFSKTQDTLGAKVFKSFVVFQGEAIDRPFLDILNSLEKIHILNTEDWFVLREIRNEIAHDYEINDKRGCSLLNSIYSHREEFRKIIRSFQEFSN